jgi:hypothetical protein
VKDSGGPHDPEEPAGERPGADGTDDALLARVLQFEIPWDGILKCGGDCVYGADLRRLAPVVPIAGREGRRR